MMSCINLLPWREKKRNAEKKVMCMTLLWCVAMTLFAVFLCSLYLHHLETNQLIRNQLIQHELTVLDVPMKERRALVRQKNTLLHQITLIHTLQTTRCVVVHLLGEFARIIPEEVRFSELQRIGDHFLVRGDARSHRLISILMRRIAASPYFDTPVLVEIKKREHGKKLKGNEFLLSFNLKNIEMDHDEMA